MSPWLQLCRREPELTTAGLPALSTWWVELYLDVAENIPIANVQLMVEASAALGGCRCGGGSGDGGGVACWGERLGPLAKLAQLRRRWGGKKEQRPRQEVNERAQAISSHMTVSRNRSRLRSGSATHVGYFSGSPQSPDDD